MKVLIKTQTVKTALCVIAWVFMIAANTALAADAAKHVAKTLIINANIFDGTIEKLATGMSVLGEGNTIAKIGNSIPAPAGAAVVAYFCTGTGVDQEETMARAIVKSFK